MKNKLNLKQKIIVGKEPDLNNDSELRSSREAWPELNALHIVDENLEQEIDQS